MHPLVWIESGRTKFLRLAMLKKRSRERKRPNVTYGNGQMSSISSRVAFPSFSLQKYNDTESVNKQYEGNTKA